MPFWKFSPYEIWWACLVVDPLKRQKTQQVVCLFWFKAAILDPFWPYFGVILKYFCHNVLAQHGGEVWWLAVKHKTLMTQITKVWALANVLCCVVWDCIKCFSLPLCASNKYNLQCIYLQCCLAFVKKFNTGYARRSYTEFIFFGLFCWTNNLNCCTVYASNHSILTRAAIPF